jgi:PKD repeat protein
VPASKPTVKIEAPAQALRDKAVSIRILASDTNSAANAAPFHFSISFGDGSPIKSVTSKSPLSLSHIFEHAGTYTVAVIATDEYGHTSIAARVTIRILALPLGTSLSNDQSSQSDSDVFGPDAMAIAVNDATVRTTRRFSGQDCRPPSTS